MAFSITNEDTITLTLVEDGEEYPLYTWIAYATGLNGENPSLNPTGKAYMAIVNNLLTLPPDTDEELERQISVFVGKWKKIEGAEGRGVSETRIRYSVNNSGTTIPTPAESDTVWKTSPQAAGATKGKYLWTQIKFSYTSGDPSYSYSVSYLPNDAVSIDKITEYYLTTDQYDGSSEQKTPIFDETTRSQWDKETITQVSASKRYLWNAEYITYTGGVDPTYTKPALIARYVQDGATGRGIDSITNYYLANNSTTPPTKPTYNTPGNWKTNPAAVTIDTTNPYLWNCEIIKYSDGTYSAATEPAIISRFNTQYYTHIVYSKDKTSIHSQPQTDDVFMGVYTGTSVNPPVSPNSYTWSLSRGKEIKQITNEYANSNSGTQHPTTNWGPTPDPQPGMYLWTKIIITYDTHDGSTPTDETYTSTYVGKNGQDGDDGVGIESIVSKYQIHTSGTDAPTTWENNPLAPTPTKKYLWKKETITYTDGQSQTFTTVAAVYGDKGEPGESAPATLAQYSSDGISNWHYPPMETDDKYIRFSFDGGEEWGTAIKIVGTDGQNAGSFVIESNPSDTIYKLQGRESTEIAFTPESIALKVFEKNNDGTARVLEPYKDYSFSIGLIDNNVAVGEITDFQYLLNLFHHLTGRIEQDERVVPLFALPNENSNTVDAKIIEYDEDRKRLIFNIINIINYQVVDSSAATEEERTNQINNYKDLQQRIKTGNIFFLFKIYAYDDSYPFPFEPDLDLFLSYKLLGVEFGVDENMAKFSQTANAINQAVNNTKMSFTENGLTITNGEFAIDKKNTEDETIEHLLYVDNEGNLQIVGNGTFKGNIVADSGTFNGNIFADNLIAKQSGFIGGFYIDSNGMYSAKGSEIQENADGTYTIISTENAEIKLLGDGSAYAKNLTLGEGATVQNFILFGTKNDRQAILYNPSKNNGKFLEVKTSEQEEISIKTDGTMRIGSLVFDGTNSEIYGNSIENTGNTFSITPLEAKFNNINATGKIRSAIFEIGSVQTVGGAMLFKSAYQVESMSNDKQRLNLSTAYQLRSEKRKYNDVISFVYLTNENGVISDTYYKIIGLENNNKTVVLDRSFSDTGFESIKGMIDIGQPYFIDDLGEISSGALIIGINSTDSESGLMLPRGMTVREFYEDTDGFTSDEMRPRLFLGDLASLNLGSNGVTGYGLYGTNVYLTGSLVTHLQEASSESIEITDTFAGINTLSNAIMDCGIDDHSRIIFWGGSESLKERDIQNSVFQVSERGSLYASRGLFTGSIITKSQIYGADIYTARLHGNAEDSNGIPNSNVLSIYDAYAGISFYDLPYSNTATTPMLTINREGFVVGEEGKFRKTFINIEQIQRRKLIESGEGKTLTVGTSKEELTTNEINSDDNGYNIDIRNIRNISSISYDTIINMNSSSYYIQMTGNKIIGVSNDTNTNKNGYITFADNSLQLSIGDNEKHIEVLQDKVSINQDDFYIQKNIHLGNSSDKGDTMVYKQATNSSAEVIGYDLYVL